MKKEKRNWFEIAFSITNLLYGLGFTFLGIAGIMMKDFKIITFTFPFGIVGLIAGISILSKEENK